MQVLEEALHSYPCLSYILYLFHLDVFDVSQDTSYTRTLMLTKRPSMQKGPEKRDKGTREYLVIKEERYSRELR